MSNGKQDELAANGAEEGACVSAASSKHAVAVQRGYRPWKADSSESERERSLELDNGTLDVAEQFPVEVTATPADLYLWVIEAGSVTAEELAVKTESLAVRA